MNEQLPPIATSPPLSARHPGNWDEAIWLERLEISTRMPRQRVRSDAAMRAIDLGALLDAVQPGEEFAQKAREQLSALRERMPGTVPALEQDLAGELDRLIAEARDLLLTRAADEA